MNLRDFRRAGHWPTLLCAFLSFGVSSLAWVLLGGLANAIVPELQLTDSEKGLLVAVPLLGGALLRPVFGVLADHLGARRAGIAGMVMTLAPLLLGWLWADSYPKLLGVGLLLGVAGANFAAALPLASRWYPPRYQGLVMGIAGAGNSGTALAAFFGPRLALHIGWHGVFGLVLAPVCVVLLVFVLFARESPARVAPKRLADYATVLRQADAWWFCFFYAITFGGFVGLASFLNVFFHRQYEISPESAGAFAGLCVLAGAFLRPLGGHLADRAGGVRVLMALYAGAGLLLLDLATSPDLAWGTVLMVGIMALLGLGNGAVFQLVPQRFGREIGVVTGVVGAAGGLGGFFLPTLLGFVREWTGSFGGGFLLFALAAFAGALTLYQVSERWESEPLFGAEMAGQEAG